MITEMTWLIKLVLAHLLTDFILQPQSWVKDRNEKHFASPKLYLHGLVTAIVALLFTGWMYWPVALIILITHIITDGWKSYRPQKVMYFVIDQGIHLLVIFLCWLVVFIKWDDVVGSISLFNKNISAWKIITAIVFLTSPAGIFIGQLTQQWREKIAQAESLANAGKWIGIVERLIILAFVLQAQYSAIGLLVAAKGIIRFNEKDRPEVKTEYLVIGTLMSIALAVGTGLLIKL